MALPQFGIHSDVRVCAECFNNASRSKKDDMPASSNGVNAATDSVSRLDINVVEDTKSEPTAEKLPVPGILECKCGMPLCICEAPAPPTDSVTLQVKTTSTPTIQLNPKPKKADPIPKRRGSTSNSKPSTIFNHGQATNTTLDRSSMDYEVSGEGLREAIKNGDTASAKKLLTQGVDANYCDKQGSSLLHLAAVFNQTEIAFALMDHGASMDSKNLQGETPLDCAPATLQYRMKKKIEESMQGDP
ncbi:ankyrin repeat and SOCS box protein 9-like isoform X2 [Olea europaea var. sylvestris]|nr:ankyrin repeat and SOCS box protein 9-like isoform X2 [Olea europaea var. sylvestris]